MAIEINESRAKRRGRTPLADPRKNSVCVWLNNEELEILNSKRGKMKKGEWLRCAAIDKLPPIVPEFNDEKSIELGKVASNLNQIARHLNKHPDFDKSEIIYISQILKEFRNQLIGVLNEGNAKD